MEPKNRLKKSEISPPNFSISILIKRSCHMPLLMLLMLLFLSLSSSLCNTPPFLACACPQVHYESTCKNPKRGMKVFKPKRMNPKVQEWIEVEKCQHIAGKSTKSLLKSVGVVPSSSNLYTASSPNPELKPNINTTNKHNKQTNKQPTTTNTQNNLQLTTPPTNKCYPT